MSLVSKLLILCFVFQLGAYVIHTIQSEWTTAIQDIITMFDPGTVSGIDPSVALNLLFSILTIIPEEVSTRFKINIRCVMISSSKLLLLSLNCIVFIICDNYITPPRDFVVM